MNKILRLNKLSILSILAFEGALPARPVLGICDCLIVVNKMVEFAVFAVVCGLES